MFARQRTKAAFAVQCKLMLEDKRTWEKLNSSKCAYLVCTVQSKCSVLKKISDATTMLWA